MVKILCKEFREVSTTGLRSNGHSQNNQNGLQTEMLLKVSINVGSLK